MIVTPKTSRTSTRQQFTSFLKRSSKDMTWPRRKLSVDSKWLSFSPELNKVQLKEQLDRRFQINAQDLIWKKFLTKEKSLEQPTRLEHPSRMKQATIISSGILIELAPDRMSFPPALIHQLLLQLLLPLDKWSTFPHNEMSQNYLRWFSSYNSIWSGYEQIEENVTERIHFLAWLNYEDVNLQNA